jgi:YnbE-like lipoprotein
MIYRELTRSLWAAKSRIMWFEHPKQGSGRRAVCAALVLLAGTLALSACVSVTAPDKPIVIELNINIKQEVIYRLAPDAEKTIEKNKDIF